MHVQSLTTFRAPLAPQKCDAFAPLCARALIKNRKAHVLMTDRYRHSVALCTFLLFNLNKNLLVTNISMKWPGCQIDF